MSASYSRERKRRLDAVQLSVDRIVDADAAYFDRFNNRSHRVRPTSQAELEANAAMLGVSKLPTRPGERWFTAVRQIAPGVRLRGFIQNDIDVEWEMPEVAARYVYELAAGAGLTRIEAQLRTAMAKRGVA